jgi:hypothetical protein
MSQNEIRVGIVRANAGKNWAKVSLVRPSNVSPRRNEATMRFTRSFLGDLRILQADKAHALYSQRFMLPTMKW